MAIYAIDFDNTLAITRFPEIVAPKAIAADAATIGIPAEVTFYDRLGITEEEVEQMKGELA